MIDIHNLERRWLKYKIKAYLPYAITAFSLIVLFIGTFVLWPEPTEGSKSSETFHPAQKIHTDSSATPPGSTPQNTTTILEPSMDFVHSFSPTSAAVESAPVSANVVITKPVTKTALPLPKTPAPKPPVLMPPPVPATPSLAVQKVVAPQPSETLSINRNETALDIGELEKRFKENANANLGLFIARYYYDHGNYSEAYNYALKTNAINSRIDESWLIFSKSLVKLGKTEQAKKTLQLYISQSGSDSARGLLDTIERGSLK
ncbi:MAG: CDC27 family protein [Sulfuricurvum sp.]|uniref:tetratricopeptide repeat protein n=1 Tax=Sulfuricurvum sp. TaxID=2025608 RepID=UPI0025EA9FFC|nr:tetratricopeptide repeat protein [Sulfuricurvum sp.]MCK9373887.1 CDC27 family protein [Sulfuricurvum sp.]